VRRSSAEWLVVIALSASVGAGQRAREAEREKGEAILAHLRERDLHGAEHGIADLLGMGRD